MKKPTTLNEFYREHGRPAPQGINTEHFAVFSIPEVHAQVSEMHEMPYNRRTYYKISLIEGRNRAEYADRTIEIGGRALLFATPKVPYNYVPLDGPQGGAFCVFNDAFLTVDPRGAGIDALPLFRPGGYPLLSLSEAQAEEVADIFSKMRREAAGDYPYRKEAIVNYIFELIHYAQKLQPLTGTVTTHTAAGRLTELFQELLDRSFSGLSEETPLELRSAGDYADRMAVHVNHLNTALKTSTGSTTTALIRQRLLREARVLLRHTDQSVADIGFTLGFKERSHFSAFFRQQGGQSPTDFRAIL